MYVDDEEMKNRICNFYQCIGWYKKWGPQVKHAANRTHSYDFFAAKLIKAFWFLKTHTQKIFLVIIQCRSVVSSRFHKLCKFQRKTNW